MGVAVGRSVRRSVEPINSWLMDLSRLTTLTAEERQNEPATLPS